MDPLLYESLVIRLLLIDEDARERLVPFILPKLFTSGEHQEIVEKFLDFYNKWEDLPSVSEFKLFVKNNELTDEINRCIMLDTSEYNDDFIKDELESWFREKLLWNNITDAADILKSGEIERAGHLSEEIGNSLSFSFDTNIGFDPFDNFDDFYGAIHEENGEVVSTGLKTIDDMIGGGVHEKAIHLFFAATNVGKTLIQTALSTNFLLKGKNVLYVTFEESEKRISLRFISNLIDVSMNEMKLMRKERLREKYDDAKKLVDRRLVIKEYPEGTTSAAHIKQLIKDLKARKNFEVEVLVVDYIGCMVPNGGIGKNANTNEIFKTITGQTRALGMEFGIPVISAMQSNRGGINSSDLELTDAADSIGQTFKADAVFGMTQSDEQKKAGLYSLSLLKSRFGPNRIKKYIGVNYDKMRVEDIANPDGDNESGDKDLVDEASVNMLKQKKENKEIKKNSRIKKRERKTSSGIK